MLIRPADWADRDAAYAVALATGDSGADASHLHRYPDLIGDVYVGPYLRYSPAHAFVLVDDEPCGYVLGVVDTPAFEAALAQEWWPEARARTAGMTQPFPADAWLIEWIANPVPAPTEVVDRYPAHGHIDLLERAQGLGYGRRLMSMLMQSLADAGAPGMHLGVSPENSRALAFYARLGFTPLVHTEDTIYLGRALA